MNYNNSCIEYIFDRPITKTLIFPRGQSSIVIDNPFINVIPNKFYIVMIDQDALNGNFMNNPCHYRHNNLSRLHATFNRETITDFSSSFTDATGLLPVETANAYFSTLSGIGLDKCYHTLKQSDFEKGRSIFVINTTADVSDDAIPIEKSGNLRVTLQCSTALTSNSVILMIGQTLGTLTIHSSRRIFTDVLQ